MGLRSLPKNGGKNGSQVRAVEKLVITSSAGANTIGTILSKHNTINILGDQQLAILQPLQDQVTTFDAFLMTGGSISVNSGGGDNTVAGANVASTSDTINAGAGNDKVVGSKGADTITLGSGADTVGYQDVAASSGSQIDTITDFVSGTDKFDIIEFGEDIQFAGNHANLSAAQAALGAGGAVEAVFQVDSNTFWVDVNNDGALNGNDLQVKLTGVTSVQASDITGDFL